MGKLEKSLNDTIEEILTIAPKTTVAKIATMLGVSRRSITRTRAWGNRVKGQGSRKKVRGDRKPDAPVTKNLKKGLQGQAKFIGVVVRNTLKEYHDKHLTDVEMKDVLDAIYTALYSVNHYKKSSSTENFIRIHSPHVEEIEGEVELLEEFEE